MRVGHQTLPTTLVRGFMKYARMTTTRSSASSSLTREAPPVIERGDGIVDGARPTIAMSRSSAKERCGSGRRATGRRGRDPASESAAPRG